MIKSINNLVMWWMLKKNREGKKGNKKKMKVNNLHLLEFKQRVFFLFQWWMQIGQQLITSLISLILWWVYGLSFLVIIAIKNKSEIFLDYFSFESNHNLNKMLSMLLIFSFCLLLFLFAWFFVFFYYFGCDYLLVRCFDVGRFLLIQFRLSVFQILLWNLELIS